MSELTAIFEVLWDKYGPLALVLVILFVVLTNLQQIGGLVDRALGRLLPSYEARNKHRREMEQRQREQSISERMDTIIVFKDLMLDYRKRLDDLELEIRRDRREHEDRMLDIVRGYERIFAQNDRTQAQVVEALRDVCDVIRLQTDRLDQINGWIKSKGE